MIFADSAVFIAPASGLALALAGMLGAIFGSFIAALVVRWPQGRTVAVGRSRCDACGTVLRVHELVPLLSWVVQWGKCRTCGAKIGLEPLLIELVASAIGVFSLCMLSGPQGWAGAVFGWLLLVLAWLDFRHFWLPDRLTGGLALVGVSAAAAGIGPDLATALIGGVGGFLALWLIASGYRMVRGHEGLGRGDPKLLGAIGLWLGWQALPLVLLGASAIGLVWVLVNRRDMTMQTRLPLGALMAFPAYLLWFASP